MGLLQAGNTTKKRNLIHTFLPLAQLPPVAVSSDGAVVGLSGLERGSLQRVEKVFVNPVECVYTHWLDADAVVDH